MELEQDVCRKARLSRDIRFDGQFFVAVHTTGIFCRPICPAVPPKEENVAYYPSAASAMANGYRPCMRCRPETAPQSAAWKGVKAMGAKVLARIEEGCLVKLSVSQLANSLGVSERYVRKLCYQCAAASPMQIEQSRRLLLAKKLIVDSNLSITDVAYVAGYQSTRRFNEAWKQHYTNPPSAWRRPKFKLNDNLTRFSSWIKLRINLPKHYETQPLLDFFRYRLVEGAEYFDGASYFRPLRLGDEVYPIQLTFTKRHLVASLPIQARQSIPKALSIVKRVFDIEAASQQILSDLTLQSPFDKLLKDTKDIRLPGGFDSFEVALRAILGQQVSVKAARTLLARVAAACGENIQHFGAPIKRAFPTAHAILATDLSGMGITQSRINTIKSVADFALTSPDVFGPNGDEAQRRQALIKIKGIGPWTLDYFHLRAFSQPDAFPAGDLGLREALISYCANNGKRPTQKQVQELSLSWRPWRAYAATALWKSLESPI